MRFEQSPHDPEREPALELGPAGDEHGEAFRRGPLADLAQQGRLADPGRSLHDQRAAVPLGGGGQQGARLPELGIPLEQR